MLIQFNAPSVDIFYYQETDYILDVAEYILRYFNEVELFKNWMAFYGI